VTNKVVESQIKEKIFIVTERTEGQLLQKLLKVSMGAVRIRKLDLQTNNFKERGIKTDDTAKRSEPGRFIEGGRGHLGGVKRVIPGQSHGSGKSQSGISNPLEGFEGGMLRDSRERGINYQQ